MSRQNLEAVLYKNRIVLSVAFLLVIVYFVLYTWVTLPSLTMIVGWRPETKLTVLQVVEESYSQYVQPGDVVLAIDGRPARRGEAIFTPPVKLAYELTLQRDEEIFVEEVPVVDSPFYNIWKVSNGILALAIWFVGLMTAKFAQVGQPSALYVGLGFQLIAAGIVSPGPAQLGAPGAWIVGNVLIFYFPLIMLYLGFVPRVRPLGRSAQRLLRSSFYLLSGLAIVAAVELLFLFPERSLKDVAGISTLTILTVLAGVSIVAAIVILLSNSKYGSVRSKFKLNEHELE